MRLRKVRIALCAAVLMLACLAAGPPEERTRSVSGVVTDRRGNLLKGAAVQLENPINLSIVSYNTREDGRYSFHELSTDVDFTLIAKYKRWFSKSKILSKFDSKKEAEINFEIPIE